MNLFRVGSLRLGLLLLLLLAGCAQTTEQTRPNPGSDSVPQQSTPQQSTDAAVPEILQFKFESLGGTTVDGTNFAGKDLALWSWAPW